MRTKQLPRLTEEDYENIWLRHREKMRRQFWSGVAIIAALSAVGLWAWMNHFAVAAVNQYVGSSKFTDQVLQLYSGQLDALNQDVFEASKLVSQYKLDARKLITIPYQINENGFTLSDVHGGLVHVEFGRTAPTSPFNITSEIVFSMPFKSPPILLFSEYPGTLPRKRPIGIYELTATKATIDLNGALGVSWVAFGE